MEGPKKIEYTITVRAFSCAECDHRHTGYLSGTGEPKSLEYLSCRHPKNPNGPNGGRLISAWAADDDCLYGDDRTPPWCPFLNL